MKKKNVFLSLIALIAVNAASLGGSINCLGFLYQPKFPEQLRED